jgi:hypothetical protein
MRAKADGTPPLSFVDLSPSLLEFHISGSGVTELFRLGSPAVAKLS